MIWLIWFWLCFWNDIKQPTRNTVRAKRILFSCISTLECRDICLTWPKAQMQSLYIPPLHKIVPLKKYYRYRCVLSFRCELMVPTEENEAGCRCRCHLPDISVRGVNEITSQSGIKATSQSFLTPLIVK